MTIKNIFFDLDRTIWDFDTNSMETFKALFLEFNLGGVFPSFDDFMQKYNLHNNRLWNEYRKGNLTKNTLRNKRFELTLKEYKVNNPSLVHQLNHYYIDECTAKTALIPGSIELLEYLYHKYPLHILTNGFDETQYKKIANCRLEKYFTTIITSESIKIQKPNPEIFQYALQKTRSQAHESMMIGDDLEVDIIGAKRSGYRQIFFNLHQLKHTELIDYEVNNLSEIKEIL